MSVFQQKQEHSLLLLFSAMLKAKHLLPHFISLPRSWTKLNTPFSCTFRCLRCNDGTDKRHHAEHCGHRHEPTKSSEVRKVSLSWMRAACSSLTTYSPLLSPVTSSDHSGPSVSFCRVTSRLRTHSHMGGNTHQKQGPSPSKCWQSTSHIYGDDDIWRDVKLQKAHFLICQTPRGSRDFGTLSEIAWEHDFYEPVSGEWEWCNQPVNNQSGTL